MDPAGVPGYPAHRIDRDRFFGTADQLENRYERVEEETVRPEDGYKITYKQVPGAHAIIGRYPRGLVTVACASSDGTVKMVTATEHGDFSIPISSQGPFILTIEDIQYDIIKESGTTRVFFT